MNGKLFLTCHYLHAKRIPPSCPDCPPLQDSKGSVKLIPHLPVFPCLRSALQTCTGLFLNVLTNPIGLLVIWQGLRECEGAFRKPLNESLCLWITAASQMLWFCLWWCFCLFFLSIERNGAMGKLVVLVDLIYAHSSPQLISCLGVCALAVFKCKTGEM